MGEIEREKGKPAKGVKRGVIREEVQQKRMMGNAFLAWPAALMRTFCHPLNARSCVIIYVCAHKAYFANKYIYFDLYFLLSQNRQANWHP